MESGDDGDKKSNRLDSGDGSQRDKFRYRNSGKGSTWTSSVHVPASDIPINSKTRSIGRIPSNNLLPGQTVDPDISSVPDATSPRDTNFLRASSHASKRLVREKNDNMEEDDYEEVEEEEEEGDADEEEEEEDAEAGDGEPAVRMSLMSLLAENDEELGSGGLAYMMEADEDDDEDDDEESGAGYNSCCVCMVKHRGTAFEPCGHSFCRLCSREMWVERGNCPLCNNYILEILDIF